jgi:hypothetical protein
MMKRQGIAVIVLLALAIAGCDHLRSRETSVGASTDDASTVKKSASTMPEGSRYQTTDAK